MKKILAYIIIAASLASTFTACKKGENDPFISFRSRKARVANEWKVTSAKGSQTESGSNPYNYSWSFDGATHTETNPSGTFSAARTMEYTFEKDGNFSYKETMDGNSYTSSGKWNFLEGVGDAKNKSQLVLREWNYTSPTNTTSYEGSTAYDVSYDIDELRNDKMVLKVKVDYAFNGGGSGTVTEEYVLESK